MKKRAFTMLLTMSLVAAQPMTILGAGSSSGRTSDGSSDDSYSQSSVVTVSDGLTATKADGQWVATVAGTTGTTGGTTNVQAAFAVGIAETAGLPELVVQAIHNINAGKDLKTTTGNVALDGYYALTTTSAIVLTDKTTGKSSTEPTEVSLYVPNLLSGLNDIKILCYDNATGQWLVISPDNIDFTKKVVTFKMTGSGTVTIIYHKQA